MCYDNTVFYNNIQNCVYGIQIVLSSNGNFIIQNNFIDNLINALTRNCQSNIWSENYWDNWIGLRSNLPMFQNFPKVIFGFPIFFDWYPQSEPYDMPSIQGCGIR